MQHQKKQGWARHWQSVPVGNGQGCRCLALSPSQKTPNGHSKNESQTKNEGKKGTAKAGKKHMNGGCSEGNYQGLIKTRDSKGLEKRK